MEKVNNVLIGLILILFMSSLTNCSSLYISDADSPIQVRTKIGGRDVTTGIPIGSLMTSKKKHTSKSVTSTSLGKDGQGSRSNSNTSQNSTSTSSKTAQQQNRKVSKASGNVVLTCLGEGSTLSDATSDALRSGIEQTYGAFVSSNTSILNDEIIKDEIISVSSGNVVSYEVKSQENIKGKWLVVVQAEISQSKLASFAESKGASVDINTSTFAMNIKLARFYRECEEKAIENLSKIVKERLPYCVDYIIKTSEPIKGCYSEINKSEEEIWVVNTWLGYRLNKNADTLKDFVEQTMKSLYISKEEYEYLFSIGEYGSSDEWWTPDGIVRYYMRSKRRTASPYTNLSLNPYGIYYDPVYNNSFVLYRNGIDITTKINYDFACSIGKYEKILCSDGFRTIVHGVTYPSPSSCSGCSDFVPGYFHKECGWNKLFFLKMPGYRKEEKNEYWFAAYRVELSFEELERFKANYKIMPRPKGYKYPNLKYPNSGK